MEKYLSTRRWVITLNNVRARCNNKKNPKYKNYGGRGIKTFLSRDNMKYLWFRDKAGNMTQPSIDRINNDDHYTLENSRFIEMEDNRKKRFY